MRSFYPTTRLLLLRRRRFTCFPDNSHRLVSSSYANSLIEGFLSRQFLSLQSLLKFHALILVTSNADNPFVAAKLVSLYALNLRPESSAKVFKDVRSKDVFLWNSIIKSRFSAGDYPQAIEYYQKMRLSNHPPDNFTVPMVVSACSELLAVEFGESIHALVLKFGIFGGNSAVGASFVYMYSKCGRVDDAARVFDAMFVRDIVSWTALVIGYVQNGESEKGLEKLSELHRKGEVEDRPNLRTFEGGFQACANLSALVEGKSLHGLAVKSGFSHTREIQSSILGMYTKCGAASEAYSSFCEVEDKDLLCWTSIISVYAKLRCSDRCMSLFLEMLDHGICPDDIIISCLLSSFHDSTKAREGIAFHGLIVRKKFPFSSIVRSALIAMYCRFQMIPTSEKFFDEEDMGNSDCWNILLSGYARVGLYKKCVRIFQEMQHRGIEFDMDNIVCIISACSHLGAISLAQSVHCYVVKSSIYENVSVSNSLIDFYGRCGNLDIAKRIFGQSRRDVVSWNTIISLHLHLGYSEEAVALFDRMLSENMTPNSATFVTVLSACSHLASLDKGEKIHNCIKSTKIEMNLSIATALMDMYGKCGQLEKSREVFDSVDDRDIISWNAMISCYGMHGDALNAIKLLQEMENSDIEPNSVTFLSLLSACNHGGLIDNGRYIFGRMQDYSLTPTLKHYACMVDLLAKSGNLQEAEDLALSMPGSPDGGIWGTLLGACKVQSEVEIGLRVFQRAVESDPLNDGYYILMSSLFESVGKWKEAEMVRGLMKRRGVRKGAGWSAL